MNLQAAEQHLNEPALAHSHTDFVRLRKEHTVSEALEEVRKTELSSRIIYFYVVDEEDRLCGIVPTRRLLLGQPESSIADLMVTKLITLPETATLGDACEFFIIHRLLALPITSDSGRLLAIIDVERYTDEMSELAYRDEYNDVFQLIGVHLAAVREASPLAVFGNRFPWLLCNIGGGLACAALAGLYQEILDNVVVLALFIPVVLALAESVSIQSLTLTLQRLHGRFTWGDMFRTLLRELPVGLLLGAGCGLLVGGAAWAWQGLPVVAGVILLSILISVTNATLLGLMVPSVLRAAQRDPKLASGPITLAATDLATLFCYLGLATVMLAQ